MERFGGGGRLKEMEMERDSYGEILVIIVKWDEMEEEEDNGKVF